MSEAAGQASLEPPREQFDTPRRLAAEGLGTALLLAVVIGSGIMGERLAGGNDAIALLGNTLATGAGLVVLITIFGPLSGAHFNPAVTLAFLLRRELSLSTAFAYVAAHDDADAVFVDDRGASLAGDTLSSPIDAWMVSARGVERIDPISHRKKFHAGTDYAAPIGTPVMAVKVPSGAEVISAVAADGKVTVSYKAGAVTSIRIYDGKTGEMIREIPVLSE